MTAPIAVYVHIPFCTVKCGYCDFNAYAGMDNLKESYAAALVHEVELLAPALEGRIVSSIGFGGGTPGEVDPRHIGAVISAIRARAPLAPDCEVSLEANPGTVTPASLAELRGHGVTRLSLGAQSFHAAELRFLDRIHSPDATTAALRAARAAGFESVSLDLIYGLPGQSVAGWRASLRAAVELGPDHISTYALTIEDGTPLARRVDRGEVVPLDADEVADLYEAATTELESAGFHQYELSNWALPGHESRHNRTYWTDGEYLGVGAGAHGYHCGERYENIAHPRSYISSVDKATGAAAVRAASYRPDLAMQMSDWLALRLRLIEGFSPGDFASVFGVSLHSAVGEVIADCERAGVLELGPRVRLTRRGRLLHGEVAARLLAHISESSFAAAR